MILSIFFLSFTVQNLHSVVVHYSFFFYTTVGIVHRPVPAFTCKLSCGYQKILANNADNNSGCICHASSATDACFQPVTNIVDSKVTSFSAPNSDFWAKLNAPYCKADVSVGVLQRGQLLICLFLSVFLTTKRAFFSRSVSLSFTVLLLDTHARSDTHSFLSVTLAQSQLRMKVNKLMFRFHGSGNWSARLDSVTQQRACLCSSLRQESVSGSICERSSLLCVFMCVWVCLYMCFVKTNVRSLIRSVSNDFIPKF